MTIKNIFSTLLVMLLTASLSLYAQEGYDIGDEAMQFSLLGTSGEMVSPENFDEAEGFIIVFTCNHCPYSKLYEDRINALDAKYAAKGYPVIAINPNDPEAYPDDSYEEMKVRAEEKGFTFPYLFDETQEVALAYGATRTPHTFVAEKENGKLIIRYIGAIDDDPKGAAPGTVYVEDAVDSLLNGEDISTTYTKAIGCSIKWKKS